MRELTITRKKTVVACAVKMKVYIEDHAAPELRIGNIPCRKIGELKNGETKHFQIGTEACKVFVIAGKTSKDYCVDYCSIPAGEAPVELSGKNRFNLATGNAYRFDGVTDLGVIVNRWKGIKIGLLILAIAVVLGFATGILIGKISEFLTIEPDTERTFAVSEMRITLNYRFKETPMDGFTACYDSENVAVIALEESFLEYPSLKNYSVWKYADAVIEGNRLDSYAYTKNGLICFEYDRKNTENNITYHYFAVIYKSEQSFWMIQFVTEQAKFEEHKEDIIKWAKSVEFA